LDFSVVRRTRRRCAPFAKASVETGYAEGRNVSIEFRWANGENELLPALAADLVRCQVNVLLRPEVRPAALAAKAATAKIGGRSPLISDES
jgi:putative ABC transport system substrate-binding protein